MRKTGNICPTCLPAVRRLLITLIGGFCFFSLATGQVSITPPNLAIETCDNFPFISVYFTLGDLVFEETSTNDFRTGTASINIQLPADFEFDTSGSPVLSQTGTDISNLIPATPAFPDPQTFQFSITVSSTATVGSFTISGLRIRGIINATALSGITFSSSPTNLFNGLADGATVATISSGLLSVTSGGTASSSQTLCPGETPAQLTVTGVIATSDPSPVPGESYQWESSTDGTNWIPVSISGGNGNSFTPPAISESIYYRRQTILSRNGFSCSDESASVFLELNQITAGAIIGNQTICEGTVASNLTQSMAASGSGTISYQWESDASGSWAAISGATQADYSPGAITTTTQYRRRDISTLNSVTCSDHTNIVTITVLPAVVGGTAEVSPGVPDQTICPGTIPATISVTGSSGGTSYEWYKSTDGTYSLIAGEVSSTLTFAATPSETTYYRRISIANGTGDSCKEFSSASIVYVNDITAGSINGTQTICNGTTAAVLTQNTAATATGTLSYQWESDESGSWTDITGATSATYSPGAIASTTQYRRKDISTLNGEVCFDHTNAVTVTVLPAVAGGTAEVSAGVPDQTVCSWDIPATISVTGGSAGLSYQWQSSTDNNTFTDIAGEVGESLSFSASPIVTTYYQRVATASGTGPTCLDESSVSTVFVNQITPGVILGNQTICNGSTASGITEDTGATHSGALTYEWESKVGTGPWGTIAGADLATYSPGAVAATTQYRRKDISTLNGEVCSDYTNTITITVLATVVGGTAEVSPGVPDQTICPGTIPATISVTGSSGGISYQWQSSTDNNTFTDIAGEAGESLSFSASPVVTTYYKRIAESGGTGPACSDESSVSTVFVNQISAGIITGGQTICNGETASTLSETTPASFSGTISYQWESDESGSWANIVGATSATYAPGVLTKTIRYRRKDTSTLNGEACYEYTNIVTVTVLAAATGGTAEVNAGVPDQTICASDIPATISVSGGSGGTGYQWQFSTDNSTFNNIPGEVAADLVFTVAPSQTNYYRRQTLNSGGGIDCPELSTVSTVFVNAITSGVIGNNQTICYNSLASNIIELSPAAPSGVLTQQWESKAGAGTWTAITGETDAGFSPGVLTQTTQYRRVDTSTLNGVACFAYSNTITVEVLPEVAGGTSAADETLCADDIPATINVTSAIGVSGQWQSSPDGSDPWTDIIGETGTSLSFVVPITETTYFRRKVSTIIGSFTCTAYSTTTAKILNTIEAGTIGSDQTVCYGTILPNLTNPVPANFAGTISYQWQSRIGTGSWTDISGATGETYSSGLPMTVTTQYRRIDTSILNSVSCTDESNIVTITVSGEFSPGTAAPTTQTVCQGGDPVKLTVTGGETNNVTYQWQQSTDGGLNFTAITGETGPEYDPPAGISTSTYYRRETISNVPATSCSDVTAPVFVEVITFDAGEISGNQTVCGGDIPSNITNITGATSNGTITYSWESSTDLINWTPIAQNQETYAPGLLSQTTHFKRIATSEIGSVNCRDETNISSVYVNQFLNDTAHQISTWDGNPGPVTVCFNSSPGEIIENFSLESTIGATITYQWQSSPDGSDPSWINLAGENSALFEEPPGVTADIFYRRVSTTTLNGISCSIESNSIKFEVGANVYPGIVATSNANSISGSSLIEIVPYGEVPAQINEVVPATGDGSIFRYGWYISTDSINYNPAPGINNTIDYTPTDPVLQTTWFRRVTYNTFFSVECGIYNDDTEIKIIVPTPGTLNNDQVICSAEDPAIVESLEGTVEADAYLIFQWESSTDNNTFSPISGENAISFNPVAGQFVQTTYLRRITNTVINGVDQGVISFSETDRVTIHVNTITPGSIDGDQNICYNTIPGNITSTALPIAPLDPAPTYEWWSSTDNISYSIISGATASDYSFTAPLTQSTYYKRRDISAFNGLLCSEDTNPVFIEVTQAEGGTISADQIVCIDENPATISVNGALGTFAQWQDSVAGSTWTDIAGEQSADLVFTSPITETTYFRRRTWSSLSGNDCSAYSPAATVFVNTITPGRIKDDQTLCYNSLAANLAVDTIPTGSGILTHQWEKNETGTWVEITGETQLNYSPGQLSQTTIFRRKDISTLNGKPCSGYTNEVTIEILPEVQGGTSSGDQSVCSTNRPATITITGSKGTNAQWQSSPTGLDPWTNIPGETGTSLAFSAPLSATTSYRLRSWETIGSISCEEFSPITTIYINTIVPGEIEDNQTLCYNSEVGNITVRTEGSGSGIITYQWQKNETGTWVDIPNADQPTYSPGRLSQTTIFRREDTSTLYGDGCPAYTNEVTIEIVGELSGGTASADQYVCLSEIPADISTDGIKGVSAIWQESEDMLTWADITGQTGQTLSFSAPLDTTTHYRWVTWTDSGSLICSDTSTVSTVYLNSIQAGKIGSDQLLCSGDLVEPLTEIHKPVLTGLLSHQWEVSTDLFNWSDIPGPEARIATYRPSPTVTSYYRRRDISTLSGVHECVAYTDTVKITLDNYPVINEQDITDNDITPVSCHGEADGSIIIPISRINGGNTAKKQIMTVVVSGTPALGDVYTLIIDGAAYSHTVIPNGLGTTQTNAEIASDLVAAISSGAVSVTVVDETITLTAQTAGIPFTAFASTGASVAGRMRTQLIQENQLPNLYRWSKVPDPAVISTDLSIRDLTAGFYQLEVSNNLCTTSAVFEITEPEPLVVDLDTTCNNSLTVRISGGNLNYVVTLKKPDNTTEVKTSSGDVTFSGLESGLTYTIEITDAPCTQTFTKVVTLPHSLGLDESLITVSNIKCGGVDDGSITLQANAISGGVEPYQYSWSVFDGPLEIQIATTKDIADLAAGTYYLKVEDNLGCTANYSATIAGKSPTVITNKLITNEMLACFGDANAKISINISSDPSSLLEINWFKNGIELTSLQNQLEVDALDAGVYHVDVVDINAVPAVCVVSDTIEIKEPGLFTVTEVAASDPPVCFSDTYRGTVSYQITGGTEPFTYQLDGGTVETFVPDENGWIEIANLDTGLHTIIFSEFNDCQPDIILEHTVSSPQPIGITYDEDTDIIDVGCNLKGSIKVNVTGGLSPYFYSWKGPNNFAQSGTNLNEISDLEEIGVYSLVVTDVNQCKSEEITIELVELTTDFEVIEVIRNGRCASNNDASIQLIVSDDIIVPYTVEWEKWDLTDPGDPDCITNCYSWQAIPSASGQLLLNNLGPGQYRATIIDGSNSLCDTYVNTFSLASSSIEIFDEGVRLPDCEDSNFGYSFKMKAENLLKFYLNGMEISLANGNLIYNSFTEQYIIKNLEAGDYLLRVVEQLPSGDEGCEILQNFTVGDFTTLSYTGATSHELNVCEPTYSFTLDTSLVEGGLPFEDTNGNSFYHYEWTTPNSSTITGFKEIPVSEGIYQLVIKDQRGCATNSILFNFSVNYNEIEVFEDIQNVSCGTSADDGAIQVTIEGGREPYSITWEKEIVNPTNGETTFSLIASNTLSIADLSPGRYRLTVLSNFDNCESTNPIVRYEAFYTVHKDQPITILNGPHLSTELCLGTPGILTIQVTETNNGSTRFYYDKKLANAEFMGNGTYEVYIDSPVSGAILNAVNEAGCGTFVIIEDGVATPSFRYESEGFLQFGITAVGEEIEFINTTTDTYDSLTWNFGDGSDIVPLSADEEKLVDIFHTYETEGQFEVTLTVFNESGCSNEVKNLVTVGKGYSVMFPNAFTPNDDGINDYFEGEFSGIVAFTLNIYDTWNNLIFTTSHETVNLPTNWGWDGNLPDGRPFNDQVFKYIFYGTRLNQESITATDNAIIIR